MYKMEKVRKKALWAAIAVFILFMAGVGIFLYCVPQTILKDAQKLQIAAVQQYLSETDETDITAMVDVETLKQCLPLLECSRLRTSFAPYRQANVTYEINGVYDGKPIHILLGSAELHIIYESSEKGGYQIKNPESWLALIGALTEK